MFFNFFLIQGRLDEWLGLESEKDIRVSLLLGSGFQFKTGTRRLSFIRFPKIF